MDVQLEARDLRIIYVDADAVFLHEESDPSRVERLAGTVKQDKFLRNPPVVAELEESSWVVLDGATRTTMLKAMGAQFLPVQVVPYANGDGTLEAWYHVLPEQAATEVERFAALHQAEVISGVAVEKARLMLAEREGVAALVHENGACTVFRLPSPVNKSPFGILRSLVSVYGGAGEIYRIVHNDLMDIVRSNTKCPEVVMFPTFTPNEIKQAALIGDVLPAGITRHLISGRVINMNIPLNDILKPESVITKNNTLANWLTAKIMEKKVRYYHEPIFVFDD